MQLLTFKNPKTAKGEAAGYLTGILHLSPWRTAGINVCPMAELAGCVKGCLNTAGRGGLAAGNAQFAPHSVILPDNTIQRARIRKTRWFAEDQPGFLAQLVREIQAAQRKAQRLGLQLAIRLNGTSDIAFEDLGVIQQFPDVQFYDYTKVMTRVKRQLPPNYHLTLSYSEANAAYALKVEHIAHQTGANVAVVFDTPKGQALPSEFMGRKVIDGDATDLRFTDPAGVVVGLRAKGAARRDRSGFVVRVSSLVDRCQMAA